MRCGLNQSVWFVDGSDLKLRLSCLDATTAKEHRSPPMHPDYAKSCEAFYSEHTDNNDGWLTMGLEISHSSTNS